MADYEDATHPASLIDEIQTIRDATTITQGLAVLGEDKPDEEEYESTDEDADERDLAEEMENLEFDGRWKSTPGWYV
jgi:hypothetical protein